MKTKTVVVFGITYTSKKDMFKTFGVTRELIKDRLKYGMSLEEALMKPKRDGFKQKITVEGIEYLSIKEAAIAYDLPYSKVYSRRNQGWTLNQIFDIESRHDIPKHIEGRIYIIRNMINNKVYIGATTYNINKRFEEHKCCAIFKTNKLYRAMRKIGPKNFYVKLLCKSKTRKNLAELERKYIIMHNSIENGYNTAKGGEGIEYVGGKKVIYKGKQYKSISELAKTFNIESGVVIYRLKNNIALEQKCIKPVSFIIEGIKYKSLSELASNFNIDRKTIRNRFAQGLRGKDLIKPGYNQRRLHE